MTARAAVALLIALGARAAAAGEVSGAALDYALACQGCHRADGSGTPGSVPPLAGSVGKLIALPGGREYLGRVPGVAQAPLDDVALAGVLNWVLERFGSPLPADFVRYTGDEVGRLRRAPLTDVEAARRRIVH